jgi:hypothetical protein
MARNWRRVEPWSSHARGAAAPIRRLRLVGLARDPLQHLARNLLRLVAVAGEERERGGVDQGIGAGLQRRCGAIAIGGLEIEAAALLPVRRAQRMVLQEPALDGQRRRIVLVLAVIAPGHELPPGMIQRPRAGEGDDRGQRRGS